ncbi:MAG: dihydropteroate synthase [Pseudomonadota bacterium]
MTGNNANTMGLRPHCGFWQTTRYKLSLHKPLVMGIVNVTPDSFASDTGLSTTRNAIELASRLRQEGADIVDVGGESTRPGATALSHEEEWQRIQPVLEELLTWHMPVSVDTYHPETMRQALDMGVDIINDIWALRQPGALQAVASYECGICLMHMHGEPASMQLSPLSGDPLEQAGEFFKQRLQAAIAQGIEPQRLVLDPGVGFGKTVAQNFMLLQRQQELMQSGLPLLLGWSRKSSLGAITGLEVGDRLVPSVVAAVLAADKGAAVLRVHDVADTVAALAVWQASRPTQPVSG